MPLKERRREASPGVRMTCGSLLCGMRSSTRRHIAAKARDGCEENKPGGSSSSASGCSTTPQIDGRVSEDGSQTDKVGRHNRAHQRVFENAGPVSGPSFQDHKECGQCVTSCSNWTIPTTSQVIAGSPTTTERSDRACQEDQTFSQIADDSSTTSGSLSGVSTKSSLATSEDPKVSVPPPGLRFMVPILEDGELDPATEVTDISCATNERHSALAVCDCEREKQILEAQIRTAIAGAASKFRSSPKVSDVRRHTDENEVVLMAEIPKTELHHQALIMSNVSRAFAAFIAEVKQLRVFLVNSDVTGGMLRMNYVVVHVGLEGSDREASHRRVTLCFCRSGNR